MTPQTRQEVTRKSEGDTMRRPKSMSMGIEPQAIQDAIMMPTTMMIIWAGKALAIESMMPPSMSFQV
jgi:hypothetical protein